MEEMWKALLAEFLGTFTLVFIGAGAVAASAQSQNATIVSAFAFGLALVAIVYVFATWSGAHVNPAVSVGAAVAGKMSWVSMIGYIIAQILGGILAAALIVFFYGSSSGVGASVGSLTKTEPWKALLLEALLTFFLVFTVLAVTHNPVMALVAGLAIGVVLAADMFAGFGLTGASMNPARSIGPALFSNNAGTLWIYILGPLLGAVLAALAFRLMTVQWSDPCCATTKETTVRYMNETTPMQNVVGYQPVNTPAMQNFAVQSQ